MFNQHLENFHADVWEMENAWDDDLFMDYGWRTFHETLALKLFPDQPKSEREGLLDWADGVSLDHAYELFEQRLSVEAAAYEFKLLMASEDGAMIP